VTGPDDAEHRAPMLVIRGDASDEEVAALLAVLQGLAAARRPPSKRPRREWSAPRRAVGRPAAAGPGGWRSSALPR
jgi:Acyl-CoA carboxylase epsilon subunit